MKNQHEFIKGYRDLSEEEIAAINAIKEHAEQTRILCETVDNTVAGRDGRWLAIATTDLQKGYMALVRSVAKPDGF